MSRDDADDLDRLLDQYEAEAAASTQAVLAKQRVAAAGRKGMHALREEGLTAPLQKDNKWGPHHRPKSLINTLARLLPRLRRIP